MKKSILRYLLAMGAIAAPTKANNTAPVVPQTPEQLLEKDLRSLSTIPKLVLTPIGLTILGISMRLSFWFYRDFYSWLLDFPIFAIP
jgi:hypothetical protein